MSVCGARQRTGPRRRPGRTPAPIAPGCASPGSGWCRFGFRTLGRRASLRSAAVRAWPCRSLGELANTGPSASGWRFEEVVAVHLLSLCPLRPLRLDSSTMARFGCGRQAACCVSFSVLAGAPQVLPLVAPAPDSLCSPWPLWPRQPVGHPARRAYLRLRPTGCAGADLGPRQSFPQFVPIWPPTHSSHRGPATSLWPPSPRDGPSSGRGARA